jgi:predicted O-methyltransferase YrrM
MQLNLSKSKIEESTKDFILDNPKITIYEDVLKPIGDEHYLFLAALSMQIKNKKIIECGTHNGRSTYSLYYGNKKLNNNNMIYTYDINLFLANHIFDDTNIVFNMDDLFDKNVRELNKEHILSSDLLFIDIDPHEGVLEYEMYCWLKENDYQGLLLLDDIHLKEGHMNVNTGNSMQKFWDKIEDEYKMDLTSVGHYSGTGIVSFHLENYSITID